MPKGSRLRVFYLLLVLGGIIVPAAARPAEQKTNLDRRVIASASELDYPPFSIVRADGTADGFSVELLRAVARVTGLEVTFKVGPWHEIKEELAQGRLDALPLVSYSALRDEVFDFTAPYLRMHGAIFVRKGDRSIHSEADLKDKEVLVMRGDTAHEYAVNRHLTDKLILTDSFSDAMQQLSAGKHDAVIVQYLVGLQIIQKHHLTNVVSVQASPEASLKPTAVPLTGFEQKFCIAVKEGDKALLARLNEGLAVVITNGTYDALYNKWFGPILPAPAIDPSTIAKYILSIVLPLLAVLGLFGVWYLRREVDHKTRKLKEEITVRQLSEKALADSENKYRELLETANSIVIRMDDRGIIRFINDFGLNFFGYAAQELLGHNATKIVPEVETGTGRDLSGLMREVVHQPERHTDMSNENITKDGRRVWVAWTNKAIFDAEKKVREILAIGNDITALKDAEKALKKSNTHLEVLAAVAQRLLGAENPQVIVEELCRLVMAEIDCQCFFNYLVDVPGRRIRLNAYAGIPAEAADSIRQLDFGTAVCGCVARDGVRIIAEDIERNKDVRTALIASFGIKAYCCHPLLIRDELIGTLSFGTNTRPGFSADEVALMQSVTDQVAVAMLRLKTTEALRDSEKRLRASLTEKEVLLKEIHHRVKNNMQVISSLVDLQADEVRNPDMHAVFRDIVYRVRSMAMVHEKLYQSDDLARVEFADYAQSLISYLWRAHVSDNSDVHLKLNLQTVYLPVNMAVPCGLILNELFSNVLKHAFRNQTGGEVTVSLNPTADHRTCLSVRDNGAGLSPDLDWKNTRTLGLRLVRMLAEQIQADIAVDGRGNGTEFTLTFEASKS